MVNRYTKVLIASHYQGMKWTQRCRLTAVRFRIGSYVVHATF